MEMEALARDLRASFPALRLTENEPMAAHTSFRIGGPAALFAEPASEAELLALLRRLNRLGVRPLIVGRGTNLLVSDAGVQGVVVHVGEALGGMEVTGTLIRAGAGAQLSAVARSAREHSLSGFEFAHGIPGSLGGAVVMNAGAYGGELRDVVECVRYLDENGALCETVDPGFSYRHSMFSDRNCTVLSALLRLTPGDALAIAGRMAELSEQRREKQPLEWPSAGSTFKRPAGGFAAAMIDGAGCKGLTVGGAQVSEKHAGFIINRGGATCDDVLRLMELVKARVREKYGVELEPEVRIISN